MWSRQVAFLILFFSNVYLFAQGGSVGCGDVVINQIPYNFQGSTLGAGDSINVTEWGQANSEDFIFTLNVSDTIIIDLSVCHAFTDFDIQMGVFEFNDTCGVDTVGPPTCRYPTGDQGAGAGVDCYSEDTQSCTESMAPTTGTSIEGYPHYRGMIFEYQLFPQDGADTTTYYIVIDGYNTTGNFQLSIDYSAPPFIVSSELDEDNDWIDLTINDGVYDNDEPWNGAPFAVQADDFTIEFQQNSGTATEVAIQGISKQDGNQLEGGESIIRLELNVGGTPAGIETIEIKPADGNSVFDGGGTAMGDTSSTGLVTLNGNPVLFTADVVVEENNSYVILIFNQGVYANTDSTGGLEVADLSMAFSQNGGNATNAVMDSLKNTSGDPLAGGEDSIRVYITVTGTASGDETVNFNPADNISIYNKYGLAMSFSSTSGAVQLNDLLPPNVSSASVTNTNAVKILMSEGIYNTSGGSGGLEPSDFNIIFHQNNGNVTAATVNAVKDDDGNDVSGGETQVYLILDFSDLPSGVETVEITPAGASSIYDQNGNAMAAVQTTGTLTLYDKLPPEIDSTVSTLATTNAYAAISISEGLYTNSTADAALLVTDFELEFDDNGGSADTVTILQVTRPGGNSLLGGEDSLWIYLGVDGSPSGVETIIISAEGDNAIFDPNGNAMSLSSSSGVLTLNPYPRVDSTNTELSDDNKYVMLVLSEGVYNSSSGSGALEASDFSVSLIQNGGNATGAAIDSLRKDDGITDLEGGEDTVIVYFSLSNPPASGVETIEVKAANTNSVFNGIGNPMQSSETTGSIKLNDKLAPFFLAAELSLDTTVTMAVSEGLYADEDGSEPLDIPDFRMDLKKNNGNTASAQITHFTKLDGSSLDGGEDSLLVHFTVDLLPSGVEEIEIQPANYAVFDKVGNPMDSSLTTGYIKLNDLLPPSILDSSSLTADNKIEVWVSESVYGTGLGSTALEASDFDVLIFQNGGNVTSVDIGSMTTESNTALTGGETRFILHLDFDDLPSGVETVKALPADTNSVFDRAGNPMEITEETPLFTLYDELPPTITNVSLEDQDTLPLIKESNIELTLSEPLVSFDLSVVAQHTDSLKYTLDTSTTALTITVLPPLASLDTIVITVDNMKDSADMVHDPQVIFTYFTAALGDFNWDDKIDVEDLSALVNAWYVKDYDYELGPVIESIPHYIPQPDSIFNLDDGMAFTQMWYWINQLQSLSSPTLTELGPQLAVEISSAKISVSPPASALTGQLFLEYDPAILDVSSPALSASPNRIVLSKQERATGRILFEYASLSGKGFSELVFEKKTLGRRESGLKITYKFYDQDGDVISQGTKPLKVVPIPEVFVLHPVYPNPFNPSTAIRFDIPDVGARHVSPLQLNIFDVSGRLVETLINRKMEVGFHEIVWSGRNQSSGVYFAELLQGNQRLVQKMVLLK